MKYLSTFLLRLAIIIAGIIVLAICLLVTSLMFKSVILLEIDYLLFALTLGIYSSAIPFFIALFQTNKLLGYIDSNKAFSEASLISLKIIMKCAVSVFLICTLGGLPFFYVLAQIEDAPGFVIIGMIIAGIAFIIALFASILTKLLQEAINIKLENDLTV